MSSAAAPEVRVLGAQGSAAGLCAYADALALMQALIARPADAPDLLLCTEHPPTLTVGRKGGREHIRSTQWPQGDGSQIDVPVHEVARGGSVTWHAPGQVVVYPIVQLARQQGPLGQGPLGDLPRFARLLEDAMQAACAAFGVETCTRVGFAGLWIDEETKIGSLGVALRGGWTWHGLALNVCTDLSGFGLLTHCGLAGVRMTTLQRECEVRGLPTPTTQAVREVLVAYLRAQLHRVS